MQLKHNWHEIIGEALWAYIITHRTPIQATTYALVYGMETIIPLKQQIPSLRIIVQERLTEEENICLHHEVIKAFDEKILETQQSLECYQTCLLKAFNIKVRLCSFQIDNLVLVVKKPIITTHQTKNKFTSK